MRLALWLVAVIVGCRVPTEEPQSTPPDTSAPEATTPAYSQDFVGSDALGDFAFSDPAAWHLAGTSLELAAASRYGPPHRSPLSIALMRDLEVGDFTLEASLMQTGREYGHRDLCIFFGFQDPANFYYLHLATTPDDHAHNVFLVDDADRRRIAEVPEGGVDWGTGIWHDVRIERTIADGAVRVFFDGELILDATDATHGRGRIGFGSFDDTGRFARIRVESVDAVVAPRVSPFVQ